MVPKFRAWDKNTNDMVDIKTIDLERDGSVGCVVDYSSINLDVSECVLMQSTGLKDKNGVEIFEGDIVFDRWANMYTPVFQNGIYMAYNPKNLMQNDPSTQFNIIWKDGCEVIGNVWEDGDLINDSEGAEGN